jgi:hypothetical protein
MLLVYPAETLPNEQQHSDLTEKKDYSSVDSGRATKISTR